MGGRRTGERKLEGSKAGYKEKERESTQGGSGVEEDPV